MFNDAVDTGRYLFHYTSLEVFLGHILPSGRLRMSPFPEVNDPRESKDWTCSLLDDAGVPDSWDNERFLALQTQFTTAMKASAKVLCLTRDIPGLDPNRLDYTYGRGYAHSRMWDRYAGHHTGVCLAFDIDTFGHDVASSVAARGTLHHMGISYQSNPRGDLEAFCLRTSAIEALGIDEALRRHRDLHHGSLFFYKSRDWETESEYRWVLLSDHDDRYEFVDVNRSLAGVIFGPDYPQHSIPMVKKVLDDERVVLARLLYTNGSPMAVPPLAK